MVLDDLGFDQWLMMVHGLQWPCLMMVDRSLELLAWFVCERISERREAFEGRA